MALTASKLLIHANEGLGGIAADSSGNGNDATLQGATWETTNQKLGAACLSLDGFNDFASGVSSFGDINWKNQPFTMVFQMHNISPISTQNPILSFGSATGTNFIPNIIYDHTNKRITATFQRADNNISGRVMVVAEGQDLAGAFHSGVITYTGSGTPDLSSLKIYIDATSVGSLVTAATFGAFQQNEYRIGRNSGGDRFKGLLDEIGVDDTVYTQEQVDEYDNGGLGQEIGAAEPLIVQPRILKTDLVARKLQVDAMERKLKIDKAVRRMKF